MTALSRNFLTCGIAVASAGAAQSRSAASAVNNVKAQFDKFSFTAVPEPVQVALACFAGILLGGSVVRYWRQSRTARVVLA